MTKKFFQNVAGGAMTMALAATLFAKNAFAQPAGGLGTINSNFPGGTVEINVGGGGFEVDPTAPTTGTVNATSIEGTINLFDTIVTSAAVILIGIVFVLFIYDLVQLFRTGDAEWGKKAIRALVLLFITVAVWGIIAFIANALGVGVGGTGVRPAI